MGYGGAAAWIGEELGKKTEVDGEASRTREQRVPVLFFSRLIRSEGNELTIGVRGDGPIWTKRMGCFDGFKSSVPSKKKGRIALSWACINGRFFLGEALGALFNR
jgi:hypothetical protein